MLMVYTSQRNGVIWQKDGEEVNTTKKKNLIRFENEINFLCGTLSDQPLNHNEVSNDSMFEKKKLKKNWKRCL